MAGELFKFWRFGRVLRDLLPNNSNIKFWKFGRPLDTFSKPIGQVTVCTPDTIHLTLSPHDVSIVSTNILQPDTCHLTLNLNVPAIRALDSLSDAQAAGFTVDAVYKEPSSVIVSAHGVYVGWLSSADAGFIVTPSTLNLVLSLHTAVPGIVDTLHLNLALHDVTTYCEISIVATPSTPSLVFNQHSVNVVTGVWIYETHHLHLNLFDVTVVGHASVSTSTLHLVFNQYNAAAFCPLDVLHLNLNLFDACVSYPCSIYADNLHLYLTEHDASFRSDATLFADTAHLIFNLYDPSIFYGYTVHPDILHLVLQAMDVLTYPASDVFIYDPLHVEQNWAVLLRRSEGAWLSRDGVNLGGAFPFGSSDVNKLATFSFWARWNSFPASDQVLVGRICYHSGFAVVNTASRYLSFWWIKPKSGGEYEPQVIETGYSLSTNRWYHISVTVDGANRKIYCQVWDSFTKRVWWNRFEPGREPSPEYPLIVSSDAPLVIGNVTDVSLTGPGADNHFDGYLDEVVIFNARRSPQELDYIRRGTYDNGPLPGLGISDYAITDAYVPNQVISVEEVGMHRGHVPIQRINVHGVGLSIAYKIPSFIIPVSFPVTGTIGALWTESCTLHYKFQSDVFQPEYGNNEVIVDRTTYPTCSMEATLTVGDRGVFDQFLASLVAGTTIMGVPLWPLRTDLLVNVHAGATVCSVVDTSNLYVDAPLMLVRANDLVTHDIVTVTQIDGNHVYFDSPIRYHYHSLRMPTYTARYDERSSYVVPCVRGVPTINEMDFEGTPTTLQFKLSCGGSAWTFSDIAPSAITYTVSPAYVSYITPKIDRTTLGTTNGLLSFYSHATTSRLAFEAEWYFTSDEEWRSFRDFFFSAKGRARTFKLPTWMYELRATQDVSASSTHVFLTRGYENLMDRFPLLYVRPCRIDAQPFTISIIGHDSGEEFSCLPLSGDVKTGDRISFYPTVRFLEDEIAFEFTNYHMCKVKTSFIEVIA